jgi:glucose-6-phosphate dehydrogenase assembly protein OpcA
MIGLWDTTGNEVVKALAAERRSAGGVTSGIALTLVVVTNEKREREAEAAATIAAAQHPCRLVIVVRDDDEDHLNERSRLDAEIVVGGRLGPCEAVVLRMHGRLALHAESVVIPLLAPDVPVVTWWNAEPPAKIAYDPLGVVGERRITDSALSKDPMKVLQQRADDYAPGDTDLAWSRITPWRTLIAAAFDTIDSPVTEAVVAAPATDPTAALMRGWLGSRLGCKPRLEPLTNQPFLHEVRITCENGDGLQLTRFEAQAVLKRPGQDARDLPLARRPLGDELAEELRRLDADSIYADALASVAGVPDLHGRPPMRVHIWHDPAIAEKPETAGKSDATAAKVAAKDVKAQTKTPGKGK